jgi:DNA-binding transcriptional ArsR family regulator
MSVVADSRRAAFAFSTLAERRANPGARGCVLRAPIVLHVDDSPVAKLERLRPRVTPAGPVSPREGGNDAIAVLLNRVEAIVVVAGAPGRGDGRRENLTGLVRAASGGRGLPEADQATPPAPFHGGIDEGDERLDISLAERLERGADGVDAHAARLLRSTSASKSATGSGFEARTDIFATENMSSSLVRDLPPFRLPEAPARIDLVARYFRALAEPTRLRILKLLVEEELSVGELVMRTGVPQPQVSNHLACLRWCGFVASTREGRSVLNRVADGRVVQLVELGHALLADNAEHVASCCEIDGGSSR